jgi:hypothetical protein
VIHKVPKETLATGDGKIYSSGSERRNSTWKTRAMTPRTAVIERGIKVKIRSETKSLGEPISLSATIRKLKPTESFRIDDYKWRRRVTSTSSFLGIKVSTHKMEDGTLLVTRVE